MIGGAIDLILAGELPDPDGGPALKVPTRRVAIEKSLAGDEAELVRGLDFGRRLAVISDATTRAVLGQRVERVLAAVAEIVPVPLPGRPRADLASVAAIRRAAGVADALIAVGAGTINDLAKYAAWLDGKPYAVFGTAPSMNGYASATASIAIGGVKKSLPAAAPAGIFFDLSILAAAPVRLIRAGLGDSLARATAQADWLLAHLVLGRPYRSAPFRLLAEEEEALFSAPEALIAGDLEAMAHLARTLVLSGFGMAVCGGSHPASQGEHLISHYMEMRCAPDLSEPLHGEQIGVTTLTMARLQERVLAGGPPAVRATTVTREAVLAHFGPHGPACWAEFAPKRLDAEGAAAVARRLAEGWPAIVGRIAAVARPVAGLESVLRRAGAPTAPQAVGWPLPLYRQALIHARELRDRYTFLDLAGDCGRFDEDGFLDAATV